MRKILAFIIALTVVFAAFTLSTAETDHAAVRVASLKGPTSMGLVKLMQDNENKTSQNTYEFSVAGTADEIVPLLAKGELDIAMVPCNLASVLYNNTQGAVQVAAINTLGVLYVVETGDEIQAITDLKGKTVYSTGKGTTPEYAMNYLLKKNGLDPEKDLTIEYKSEATEVAAALANDSASVAVLPQPYVTAVMAQNENVRVALSLTEEWDKVGGGSALITGVMVVRTAFAQEHPEQLAAFMTEYAASAEYVNANPKEASEWIAALGIVAKAPLAEKAIPACNIVCLTGEEMKTKVAGYLAALYEENPKAVGGTLPDDAFYYIP